MARADATAERTTSWFLGGRVDGLGSAILVFPLFLVYQLGILGGRGQNGVDLLTRQLVVLAERDVSNYLGVLGVSLVAYAAVVMLLYRRGRFDPRTFAPMLLESSIYALTMGSIIVFVMQRLIGQLPGLVVGSSGMADAVVISAGAGFHEELVFRVIIMGGLAWAFTGLTGERRAWLIALVLSSLTFSLAHHVGPSGEPFTFAAFTYRTLAGGFFALVYRVRGFAVAAWSHALYDLYVLGLA